MQTLYTLAAHEGHGHQGQKRTFKKLSRRVFWPKMEQDIKDHCRSCLPCQRLKSRKPKHQGLMKTWFSTKAMSAVHLDLVGPYNESTDKFKYVLTCRCRYTRWSTAIPLRGITAEEVADAFLKGWIYTYGSIPDYIVTDRGSQFTGKLFKNLSSKLGIQQRFTSA